MGEEEEEVGLFLFLFLFQKRAARCRCSLSIQETNVKMFENGREREKGAKDGKKGAAVHKKLHELKKSPATQRMTAETFLGPAPNDLASRRRSSNIRSYTKAEEKKKREKGSLSLSLCCLLNTKTAGSVHDLTRWRCFYSLSLSCL